MIDKEQIMINGVDVSGCEYACNTAFGKNGCKHPMMKNIYCSKNPNCYFKQLARKTQECEELKKQLETAEEWRIKAEGLNEKLELRNTCYRKALEEIEKVINNILNSCLGRNTVNCRPAHNVCGDLIKILDIINKAKGGVDE